MTMELTDDQKRTIECADAWLRVQGLPTYSELRGPSTSALSPIVVGRLAIDILGEDAVRKLPVFRFARAIEQATGAAQS